MTKYIIIDDCLPIVFCDGFQHDAVIPYGLQSKVTSAGFCEIETGENGKLSCRTFGKSISLGKESLDGDSEIILGLFQRK